MGLAIKARIERAGTMKFDDGFLIWSIQRLRVNCVGNSAQR
jgi:hypothetical protein